MESVVTEKKMDKEMDREDLAVLSREILNQDKMRILQVLAAENKANDCWVGGEIDDPSKNEAIVTSIKKVMDDLGLVSEVKEERIGDKTYRRLFVAKNQNDLEELLAVQKMPDSRERDVKLGRIYGFPETAILAYPNESISRDELPEVIRKHPYFENFFGFRLSKGNYQEEWNDFCAKIDKIKNRFPELVRLMGMGHILD